jgi:heat shock protein 1/8
MVEKTAEPSIGIDLGTTYSCVGVWQNDKVDIIPNEYGLNTTPSYVAFVGQERIVGEKAKLEAAKNLQNVKNTVFDAKRLIGRKFKDDTVQDDRKLWPFEVEEAPFGQAMIRVDFQGESKVFLPEQISAMVLEKLKSLAEKYTKK